VLAHHDHEQFEIVGYYNQNKHDSFTERLQSYTDHWRDCFTMSDEALAKTIREDQIDILIDLAGHTGNNRLLVFARKPAPIQMTYLGYPRSTGVETIDYRLTDNYVDVQGLNEEFNSEQLIKLPNSYFCYRPLDKAPPINDLPAKERGYITFGCFNQLGKLTTAMQILWAKLLNAIPNAKLLLKNKSFQDEPTRRNLLNKLIQLGITAEHLQLEPTIPDVHEHLKLYQRIDIALDTYPYNGATTTCEALWMGVPVISLQGETQVSRMGLSILSTVGLSEWVASTPEEYFQLAIKFANDINQLQQLRQTMRQRLQASPLLDGITFTRHLEQVYRQVWEKWCEQ
jgi:predicted O-linked N-acetylglucosamine transferase (SPINDLY family)